MKDISSYVNLLTENGVMLLSGFLFEEVDQVENEGKKLGLKKVNVLREKEWCMLHLSRSQD